MTVTDRVEALEAKVTALENSLKSSMEDFKETLLQEMSKILDHRTNDDRNSGHNNRGSLGGDHSSTSGGKGVLTFENPMEEYWLAARKVELPLFDGRDPVGWITRAETFRGAKHFRCG